MDGLFEDVDAFIEVNNQFRKKFNETSKLKKHGALLSSDYSLFISNCLFKDHMCTYVRGYDSSVDQFQFEDLNNLVNPDLYNNGVIIFSAFEKLSPKERHSSNEPNLRNVKESFFEKQSYIENVSVGGSIISSPVNDSIFNSTEISNKTEMSATSANCSDPDVPCDFRQDVYVEDTQMFYCGKSEHYGEKINIGGTAAFHRGYGLVNKSLVFLDHLIPLSMVEAEYISAVFVNVVKKLDIEDAPTLLICTQCKPRSRNVLKRIIFARSKEEGKVLHIASLSKDGKLPEKKEEDGISTFLATYDIFQSAYHNKGETGETSLKIDFHWSGKDFLRKERPPHSAIPVIQLQVAVGETRSTANDIYLELNCLDTMMQSEPTLRLLSNYQLSSEVRDKLVHFKDSLLSLLDSSSSYRKESESGEKSLTEYDRNITQLLVEAMECKNTDFTDHLWSFIKDFEMDSVYAILDDIVYDIANSSLQIALNPNNGTKLADCIRKLYKATDDTTKSEVKEKLFELVATEQAALKLIGEIGYEKLRKQYFNFFLSKELTSLTNLQKLCKQAKGHFDVAALWKLHYCLEIVITPTMYVSSTVDCQFTLLNAAIDYYSRNDVTTMSPTFCLSLLPYEESSAFLHTACESRQPIFWQHGKRKTNRSLLDEAFVTGIKMKAANCSFSEGGNVSPPEEELTVVREEVLYLPGGGV